MVENTRIEVSQTIRLGAEALTILALTSYAFGFVIVNSFLMSYGYTSNSLFKTTYISAGVLFILLILPFAFALWGVVPNAKWSDEQQAPVASLISALPVFSIGALALTGSVDILYVEIIGEEQFIYRLLVLSLLLVILLPFHFKKSVNRKTVRIFSLALYFTILVTLFHFIVVLGMVIISLCVFVVIIMLPKDEAFLSRLRSYSPRIVVDLIVLIFASFIALSVFGTTLYGHIKPQFGGGLPTRVKVILNAGSASMLTKNGGPINIESLLADAQLLESTDDHLLVLLKSSHNDRGLLMQIHQSTVGAVVYRQSQTISSRQVIGGNLSVVLLQT